MNEGRIGRDRYPWIAEQFDEPNDIRILAVHHHLVPIPATGRERNIVLDAGDLLLTLTSLDVDVVLCGHKHVPYFWGLNGMLICNSGTAGTHRVRASTPPSWNELHVDASTIKVFVHYLDGRRELSVIFSRKTRALTRESFFVTRRIPRLRTRCWRSEPQPRPPLGVRHPARPDQLEQRLDVERRAAQFDREQCPSSHSTIAYSAQGLMRMTFSRFANGSPTLPGIDEKRPVEAADHREVRVAARRARARSAPSSICASSAVRRRRVDEVLVRARRAVERDEPGTFQLLRERLDERAVLSGQMPGPPLAHLDELPPDLGLVRRESRG